ncbi:uncharacterized protein PV09_09261 [Verruconis gallopava]|uniref:Tyrosine specific protein phosphatases domain-containing protein n=1 Tax=Verruconis gallopava TaxID=253628 RepID=A0A0D1ZY84_9PEZI|nr:uncharacterized protein PV09_09261 [Verruconis gallopava]KIV99034.1 hypothetical protein PV09_09261 [Verruconis gallopava]
MLFVNKLRSFYIKHMINLMTLVFNALLRATVEPGKEELAPTPPFRALQYFVDNVAIRDKATKKLHEIFGSFYMAPVKSVIKDFDLKDYSMQEFEELNPFIDIPNLPNVRDIGGYPIVDSFSNFGMARVRKGLIFRGSDSTQITQSGCQKFREQGISTQFDLRSQQQIDRAGTIREIPGVTRYWTPIFGEEEYTVEKAGLRYQQYAGDGTEGIVQAFTEILTHGTKAFKQIMTHIACLSTCPENEAQGIYISCTTGNNRTGPFIAMLLSFLKVPGSIVCAEYALSEQGLAPTRAKTVARLRSNSKFAASFDENELDYRAARMSGAREESMIAFLKAAQEKWNGADGYFRDVLGLDEQTLDRVREVMTTYEKCITTKV